MKTRLFLFACLIAVLLPSIVQSQDPYDPGIVDTLRLIPNTLVVGESRPIGIWFWNDDIIDVFLTAFRFSSRDTGNARVDSIVWVDRLADPSVLAYRGDGNFASDGVLPDTFQVLAFHIGNSHRLSPGQGVLYEIYLTGLHPGTLEIDSLPWVGESSLDFVVWDGGPFATIHPFFRPVVVEIEEATDAPEIVAPASVEPTIPHAMTTFEVSGSSEGSDSVIVQLLSLRLADDSVQTPVVPPITIDTNPLTFQWQPGNSDIGIWHARFRAEDGAGMRTEREVILQVVSGEEFVVKFLREELPNSAHAFGLSHADCDDDGAPELIMAGTGLPSALAVYDYEGQLHEVYDLYTGFANRGLQVAYLNSDNSPDLIVSSFEGLESYRGGGDNTFELIRTFENRQAKGFTAALLDIDGGGILDYAIPTEGGFSIFMGAPDGAFSPGSFYQTADSAISLNSADFNDDGWDDLAVGTINGLEIYLHNGEDSLVRSSAYDQTFGTRDIQVTNQGADVNNDGRFDLCLSTPSVGGATSNLMLYLGNADGSFIQHLVRTVNGQIFANCLGDFNNDTDLDIAYINGTKKYLGILFGNGSGSFENELRYQVPSFTPFALDAMDIDTDGDMDIVVSSYKILDTGVMYCYLNQVNPSVLSTRFEVRAEDNARLQITSPSGAKLDETKQIMPASSFYRRSFNQNAILDAVASGGVAEPGGYLVTVSPKPNLPEGDPFSLDYSINGELHVVARSIAMPAEGYQFIIYPDGNSPIEPELGKYVTSPSPHFRWPNLGSVLFQLATDPTFTSIVDSATVTGGQYTTGQALSDDSTMYYWRVLAGAGIESAVGFNSFIVVPVPTDADDNGDTGLPTHFALYPNYPNPFNPSTTIMYDVPRTSQVKLAVYNILGQEVVTLVDGVESAGTKQVVWNGRDSHNSPVTSGVYLYRLTAGDFRAAGKMLMLK